MTKRLMLRKCLKRNATETEATGKSPWQNDAPKAVFDYYETQVQKWGVLGTLVPKPFVQVSPQNCSQVVVSSRLSTSRVRQFDLGLWLRGKSTVNRRIATCSFAIRLTLVLDAEQRLAQVEEFSSQTPVKLLRVCQCRRNNLCVGEAPSTPPAPPGAARPNKDGSSESALCGAGRARGEPSARPGLPAPPARHGSARLGSASGGSAGCAAGGRLPAARALSAPVSSPPPPILRPLRLLLAAAAVAFSAPAPGASPRLHLAPLRGLPRRAGQDGIAAGSLWEFRGEEICLHLETSAKAEDLLTGQTALAGVQKSYTKNPLEHHIPLFGVWTRVWHSFCFHRSLPLARGARRGRQDSHIFQREERSQRSRLIRTCVGCPCPTKAAFKRETQCYLMSCEMRHCC
ncbi:uncharacterized protein LOC128808572 [Vidua macroura]|uniref:uncharacterized protein LOC128808572 n=1 Tax=Vidua macroura TaxID=187451 RepID=UPI0023A8CE0D|nr:uncharacterized protein LOC128808572 [Vidua macroura]